MATKMEVAEAEKWANEVRTEVAAVNKTLCDVYAACHNPFEDDVIIQMVSKTGKMLSDTWDAATKAYENAWKDVEDGIQALGRAGMEAQERFESFMGKHR